MCVDQGGERLGQPPGAAARFGGHRLDHPEHGPGQRAADDVAQGVQPRFAGAQGRVVRGDDLHRTMGAQRQVGRLHRLQPAELPGLVEIHLVGQGAGRVERSGIQPGRDRLPVDGAAGCSRGVHGEYVEVRAVQPSAPQLDAGGALFAERAGGRHDVPGDPGRCHRHPCVEAHPRQTGGVRPHGSALRSVKPHVFRTFRDEIENVNSLLAK